MYEIKRSVKVDMPGNRKANVPVGPHRASSMQHKIIIGKIRKKIHISCPRLLAHEHRGNATLRNSCRYLPVDTS